MDDAKLAELIAACFAGGFILSGGPFWIITGIRDNRAHKRFVRDNAEAFRQSVRAMGIDI